MIRRHERRGWVAWLVAAALLALPASATAQGADELASMIQQSLDGIAFRIDMRPKQAADDLEAQQRRIELLEKQEPNHPALPALRDKMGALRSQLAAGLVDAAKEAANGADTATGTASAPEDFKTGLKAIGNLQDQAEAELARGRPGEAAAYIEEAEVQMARLEARHEGEIPQGHVPLMVAKERLATLKDQVADAGGTAAPAD